MFELSVSTDGNTEYSAACLTGFKGDTLLLTARQTCLGGVVTTSIVHSVSRPQAASVFVVNINLLLP